MKLTRREMGILLASPHAAAQPAAPQDEDARAAGRIKTNSGALDKIALPLATEPAFVFRA